MESRETRRGSHTSDNGDGRELTIPRSPVKPVTTPYSSSARQRDRYVLWSRGTIADDLECGEPDLACMERFGSTTNLLGFLRLSEVVVE
jgi:hypothetical protein